MSSVELQLVFWAGAVLGAGVCASGLLLWTRGRPRTGFALLAAGTSVLVGLLVLARELLLPAGVNAGLR
jgi:hypothetical protein